MDEQATQLNATGSEQRTIVESKKLSGKVTAIDVGHFTIMVPDEMQNFLLSGLLRGVGFDLKRLSDLFNRGIDPQGIKEDEAGNFLAPGDEGYDKV